ncbi:hypothetical protein KIH87_15085 [Paraneptunicella aestuarii]|uniref:hypothetical protein n=1 Tax=Paraneptunicella aestuarii TaxID=2831148 RepID=UPI001E34E0AA|nr:hypothetical protein [Paraneptunicella aestuarii]UAA38001.1 hypothetical protein KIH87_15085 [Paraneptunicella aestuarii]
MRLHVFYNGTDSNYDKDFRKEGRFIHGEIVSRFGYYAKNINNQEQANVLRIHGVGGSKTDGNIVTNTVGTAFGVKMREDVQNICNFVMEARDNLFRANQQRQQNQRDLTLTVTLMGWSRGGIGCIYAAHMLSKIWDKVESEEDSGIDLDIKVIAFDPVSGLGTNIRALDLGWTDIAIMGAKTWLSQGVTRAKNLTESVYTIVKNLTNWWELPEHVSEFHGFYAHDERSHGFATTMPTMLGDTDGRTFCLYEVPGTHSTLVGNLYPYGGAEAAQNGNADPVGLHIYRSVVSKVGKLLAGWNVQLDASITQDWLQPLNLNGNFGLGQIVAPSGDDLSEYKDHAQRISIVSDKLTSLNHKDIPGLADGRGVYLGGNKQDRKWKPEDTLTEFLGEQNSKSMIDSWYQAIVGSETKLEKLKGNVSAHDYNLSASDWD